MMNLEAKVVKRRVSLMVIAALVVFCMIPAAAAVTPTPGMTAVYSWAEFPGDLSVGSEYMPTGVTGFTSTIQQQGSTKFLHLSADATVPKGSAGKTFDFKTGLTGVYEKTVLSTKLRVNKMTNASAVLRGDLKGSTGRNSTKNPTAANQAQFLWIYNVAGDATKFTLNVQVPSVKVNANGSLGSTINAGGSIGQFTCGVWYTVESVLDNKAGTLTHYLYDASGNLVGGAQESGVGITAASYLGMTHMVQIPYVGADNNNNSRIVDLDVTDISITGYNEEVLKTASFTQDFDGLSDVSQLGGLTLKSGVTASLVTESSSDKALKITSTTGMTANSFFSLFENNDISAKKIGMSYRVRFSGLGESGTPPSGWKPAFMFRVTPKTATGSDITEPWLLGISGMYGYLHYASSCGVYTSQNFNSGATGNWSKMGTTSYADQWLKVDSMISMATNTISYHLTDESTGTLIDTVTVKPSGNNPMASVSQARWVLPYADNYGSMELDDLTTTFYTENEVTANTTFTVAEGGTVTAATKEISSSSDDHTVTSNVGEPLSFTVAPDAGYRISAVTYGGQELTPDSTNTYSVTPQLSENITARNGEVIVSFTKKSVDLTLSIGANGTVSYQGSQKQNGDVLSVDEGSFVTLTYAPAQGYELERILYGTTDLTAMANNGSVTFTASETGTVVQISFQKLPVTQPSFTSQAVQTGTHGINPETNAPWQTAVVYYKLATPVGYVPGSWGIYFKNEADVQLTLPANAEAGFSAAGGFAIRVYGKAIVPGSYQAKPWVIFTTGQEETTEGSEWITIVIPEE